MGREKIKYEARASIEYQPLRRLIDRGPRILWKFTIVILNL